MFYSVTLLNGEIYKKKNTSVYENNKQNLDASFTVKDSIT